MNRARTNRKIVKGWKGLLVLAGALLLVTAATGCERLRAADAADLSNAFGPKAEARAGIMWPGGSGW